MLPICSPLTPPDGGLIAISRDKGPNSTLCLPLVSMMDASLLPVGDRSPGFPQSLPQKVEYGKSLPPAVMKFLVYFLAFSDNHDSGGDGEDLEHLLHKSGKCGDLGRFSMSLAGVGVRQQTFFCGENRVIIV